MRFALLGRSPSSVLNLEPERVVDTIRVIHRSHEPVPELGSWDFV